MTDPDSRNEQTDIEAPVIEGGILINPRINSRRFGTIFSTSSRFHLPAEVVNLKALQKKMTGSHCWEV